MTVAGRRVKVAVATATASDARTGAKRVCYEGEYCPGWTKRSSAAFLAAVALILAVMFGVLASRTLSNASRLFLSDEVP